jgi:hypothetical protein
LLRKESWLIYPQGETQMWRRLTQLFNAPEVTTPPLMDKIQASS